jgi:hypothetical protein
MTLLLPGQLQVLRKTLGDISARASALLGSDINRVERFLTNVTEFARVNSGPLGKYTYLLLFDGSASGGPVIDAQVVVEGISKGKSVFLVDEELRLVEDLYGGSSWTECSEFTTNRQALGLRLERGTYFHAILSGKVEDEGDFEHPTSAPPRASRWLRPMREFDLILADHKKECVDREQGFRYWHDKERRILLVGSKGKSTEELFHRSLFWWLKRFVADGLKVYAETHGFGQGRTDIVVVTLCGAHVLELKWLGENQNSTSYGEKDIDAGLIQVATYLDDDSSFTCGDLVIYDGRSRRIHETSCGYDEELVHDLCNPPKILFLETESPSHRAKRIARERRREQDDY